MFGLNRVICQNPRCQQWSRLLIWKTQARLFNSNSNYYEILGIEKNASDKEIKLAFLAQSKKWHPDRNREPGATLKFVAVREAYDCLSSAKSRREYDANLKAGTAYRPGSRSYSSSYTSAYAKSGPSWQGKPYWKWTPEEEEEFRRFFYKTEGMGQYGHKYRGAFHPDMTFWEKYGIIFGLLSFGVVFTIVRFIHFKYVYNRQQNKYLNDLQENDKKQKDFKKRFYEAVYKDLEDEEEVEENTFHRKHALSGILETPEEAEHRKLEELRFQKDIEYMQGGKEHEFMGIPVSKEITPLKKEHQGKELKPVRGEHTEDKAEVLDSKYSSPISIVSS